MDGTHYKEKDVTLLDDLELCEGCGQYRHTVVTLEPSGFFRRMFRKLIREVDSPYNKWRGFP